MKKKRSLEQFGFGTGIASEVNNLGMNFLLGTAFDGLGDIFGGVDKPVSPLNAMIKTQFANGGTVGGLPVEVENDEVAETPMGAMMQFDGATHENGGIDVKLPEGTNIFSDRIAIDGVTMADRKLKRERRLKKMSKAFSDDGTDIVGENTLKRTKMSFDREEQHDLAIQHIANIAVTPTKKAALGTGLFGLEGDPLRALLNGSDNLRGTSTSETTIPELSSLFGDNSTIVDTPIPTTLPTSVSNVDEDMSAAGVTKGDGIGAIGNLISGVSPLLTTLGNRAGDTPNVNSFKGFGQDALSANAKAKMQLAAIKTAAQQKLQLAATGARNRNRNSASSVNTLRALDLGTEAQVNNASADTDAQFAQMSLGLFGQEAALENQQDSVVMGGEAQRDLADRQDRDVFWKNLSASLQDLGKSTQKQGKDMNITQSNEDALAIIADLSKYGVSYVRGKDGRLKQKKVK